MLTQSIETKAKTDGDGDRCELMQQSGGSSSGDIFNLNAFLNDKKEFSYVRTSRRKKKDENDERQDRGERSR